MAPYRPRRVALRDGREVTLRAIRESDAAAVVRAFERLSPDSRYQRFQQHKKTLDPLAVERGVHPRAGRDFAFVATVPREGGDTDIVGAAQYVRAAEDSATTCEFAITVAEDWRGSGLARRLMESLLRRAPRDGYETMEGLVLAGNTPMLALARRLGFTVESAGDDLPAVRVWRPLRRRVATADRGPQPSSP